MARTAPVVSRWEIRLMNLVDHRRGVVRLWAAVLEQGIREAQSGNVKARRWFLSRDYVHLGDFEAICAEIDLPAGEIRRYVLG